MSKNGNDPSDLIEGHLTIFYFFVLILKFYDNQDQQLGMVLSVRRTTLEELAMFGPVVVRKRNKSKFDSHPCQLGPRAP